jgi:3-oxoacyl-[acyl-carrier protein] reductase
MADRYASFANSGAGRILVKRLGLPGPVPLRRFHQGDRDIDGAVLIGGAGRLAAPVAKIVESLGAHDDGPRAALVFDATGIAAPDQLDALYDFFHPVARSLRPCGRVLVLGTAPESCATPAEATAQRALEGFVRSVGKEFGRGTTAQLVYAAPDADLESTLRFLLSARSAYVSGQVIRVGAPVGPPGPASPVALVTGAARGIGAAIASVLAREGAHVICLDIPAAGDALAGVANSVRGTALQLDLTEPDAPSRLVDHLRERHGRVDVVVHNAGITRDKTLARMSPDQWSSVLAVNLVAPVLVTEALVEASLVPPGGRIVAVSSISGVAGNRGQTNYATSKAGVIGFVSAAAAGLASRGVTVNGVAPGFIETRLTAAMPLAVREAGRRMNSLAQGGLPVDVAETIGWLVAPGSGGVTGQVVRVCGQSLLGA